MKTFTADYLREIGTDIFLALGAPADEAAIVAAELVEASLMGLESHGVTRYIWYANEVLDQKIKPGAPVEVLKETPTTAVVDVNFNFGQIGAHKMMNLAAAKARAAGISCIISRHCHHVSCLGLYTQRIARHDLIGMGTVCSHKAGHWVVPWGGRKGRLATNPISYAAPTSADPVVLDMSTSMISEGKIRVLMHQHKELPDGCILDGDGNPTKDPKDFYGPPRGVILPFGGELGYKGFGLSLLTMVLGEVLAGEDISDEYHYVNGLALMAINPAAFGDLDDFKHRMDAMLEYMKNTPPAKGFKEVILPGELEFRMRHHRLKTGIPLAEKTWKQIRQIASKLGVHMPKQGPSKSMKAGVLD